VDPCERYRPARLLQVGGMAVVWVAEDRALEREVASDMTHPKLLETIRKDPAMGLGLMEDLARIIGETERRVRHR
jgi:hypothetical protein